MTASSPSLTAATPRFQRPFRSPRRITITIPEVLLEALIQRSTAEGRSLSNLAAFLLELSLNEHQSTGNQPRD